MAFVSGPELFDASTATVLMAGFGPVTSTAEALATSVGAGVLLGGFGAGVLGVILGWERRHREECAVNVGYGAGLFMAVAAAIEGILG